MGVEFAAGIPLSGRLSVAIVNHPSAFDGEKPQSPLIRIQTRDFADVRGFLRIIKGFANNGARNFPVICDVQNDKFGEISDGPGKPGCYTRV